MEPMNEEERSKKLRFWREEWRNRCISLMTNPALPLAGRQICRLKLQAFPLVCEGHFDRALAILTSDALLIDHPYCQKAIAHVLQVAGKWEPLVAVRTKILKHYPERYDVWVNLADAVRAAKGPQAAVEVLREGFETGKDELPYLFELCRLECLSGCTSKALEVERLIRDIAPGWERLLQRDEDFRPIWRYDPESEASRDSSTDAPEADEDFLPERGFL